MDVLLVCRGSVEEGLGHVVRAAEVGRALVRGGATVELCLVGDEAAARFLGSDPGFPTQVLPSEVEAVAALADHEARIVAFDGTHFDQGTFDALGGGRVTASLSPIFNHQHAVDLVFLRTRYAADGTEHETDGRVFAGLDWTVVRPDVTRIEHSAYVQHLYAAGLSVGVAMGGADAANTTLQVIHELRDVERPMLFWVMLGEGYSHSYADLAEAVRHGGRHEIVLARTGRSMWTVLQRCSLVVLAGGVTTYEAAHAGLPSLNLVADPRWHFLLRELEEAGAATTIDLDVGWGARLRESIDQLDADRDRLFLMHRRARTLVDGGGADRIAQQLLHRLVDGTGGASA